MCSTKSWLKAQSVTCGESKSPAWQSCSLTRVVCVNDSEDGLQIGVVPVHGLQDAVVRPLLGKKWKTMTHGVSAALQKKTHCS